MKKNPRSIVILLSLVAILISACSPEFIADPSQPGGTTASGGPVFIPPSGCPLMQGLSYCKSPNELEGLTLNAYDAALLAAMHTPWPVDEEIAAVVWAGDKVVKIFVYATALWAANNAIDYTVHEIVNGQVVELEEAWEPHNRDHDVEKNVPAVTAMIAGYQTWLATGGPKQPNTNGDFACRVLKVAGQVVKYVIWQKEGLQLLVYGADGTWTTYYTGKSFKTLMNPPKNYRGQGGKMETFDCNNLPPFPPLPS